MATKNRVVRIDDELWNLVRGEAERVDEPVAEVVRYALRKHLIPERPPCFFCTEPADFRREVPISSGTDKSEAELVRAIASGDPQPWERSAVMVVVHACGPHDKELCDYLLSHGESHVGGFSLTDDERPSVQRGHEVPPDANAASARAFVQAVIDAGGRWSAR